MPNDQGDTSGAIQVQFPGLTPAEASRLARELEAEFRQEGASADQVRVARAASRAGGAPSHRGVNSGFRCARVQMR